MSEVFYRRLATAAVFAGLFSFAATFCLTPACLNQVGAFYRAPLSTLGKLFLLQSTAFFGMALVAGRLSDRWRRLPVLSIGGLTMAVGAAIMWGSSSFPMLVLAMIVMGAGGGFTEGVSMAILVDLYSPERRTAVLNGSQTFFALGAVVSPAVASRVIAGGGDWRTCFMWVALIALLAHVIALAAAEARKERPHAHQKQDCKHRWTTLATDPLIIALSVGMLLYVAAESAEGSWAAVHFKQGLHSRASIAVVSVSFFWGGIGLGRLAAVWMSRHFSDTRLIIGALALAAVSQAVLLLLHQPILALGMIAVLGFALGPIWPTIVSRAGSLYPGQSGTALGVLVATGAAGCAIYPPIVGKVAEKLGIVDALWGSVIILLANLLLFAYVKKRLTAAPAICDPEPVSASAGSG